MSHQLDMSQNNHEAAVIDTGQNGGRGASICFGEEFFRRKLQKIQRASIGIGEK